jgi:predicted amidophosphoribosyltransferase
MPDTDAIPATLSPRTALASLRSRVCPACGGRKPSMKSLCITCYHELPKHLRDDLYLLIGQGYEETLISCLHAIKAEAFWTVLRDDA